MGPKPWSLCRSKSKGMRGNGDLVRWASLVMRICAWWMKAGIHTYINGQHVFGHGRGSVHVFSLLLFFVRKRFLGG